MRCLLPPLAAALLLLCAFTSLPHYAHAALEVRSAILMDVGSGEILYQQNADEPIPPASLTKVLSMYMAMERLTAGDISLQSPVRVSRGAARTRGSRMALKAYEYVPLEQLLLGMAVSSGNDATAALAEYLGGSQDNFVQAMNRKAQELGMRNSYFCNPHGLPAEGQITTARDMLLLSYRYLQAYPEALRFHSTRYIRHNGVVTYNKNPLLGNYAGADGLKTGWVNASGYNLISTVEQDGRRLLAVIMGAENSKQRGRETHRLIEAGFLALRGEKYSVADALPTMPPLAYTMTADNTAREAYAVLAPESLAGSKTLRKGGGNRGGNIKVTKAQTRKQRSATVQAQKKITGRNKTVDKGRKEVAQQKNTEKVARKKSKPKSQASKQRKEQEVPRAALTRPRG